MDDKTAYTQGVYPPTAPPAQYGQYGQSQGQLQPQYQQQQYGQPVQAYPDPGPQVVYVQQQVSQQAPGLLDMRSMQEQAADTNRTMQNPDGKKDIDQYAWCCLAFCIWPIPICAYVWCCGGGESGLERPCGERGCDPDRLDGVC